MLPQKIIATKENPQPVRIRFRKVGMLQYISHLDLQRTFEKVLVRAGLPVWYTQGFNPHAKMVFALPLSVGAQSEVEYLDIKIVEDMTFDEIKERLNSALTDELSVLEVYEPRDKFADIGWAEYEIVFVTDGASEALAKDAEKLFSSPVVMTKRSKSGDKEVDITPMIKTISSCYSDGKIIVNATLAASSSEFLNPELLVTALRDKLGFLSHDIMREGYDILRKNVYLTDGATVFK